MSKSVILMLYFILQYLVQFELNLNLQVGLLMFSKPLRSAEKFQSIK